MKVIFFALLVAGINAWPHSEGVRVFHRNPLSIYSVTLLGKYLPQILSRVPFLRHLSPVELEFSKLRGYNQLPDIDWNNERLVTDSIASAIQDASQAIKDAGLDPLHVNRRFNFALPVDSILDAGYILDNLFSHGLSDIRINNLSFSIITYRLRFDIEIPLVVASLEKGEVNILCFGSNFKASASGSVEIERIRLQGNARFSIGIITGISLRSIDIDFSFGGFQPNLNVVIQNKDFSYPINNFLGNTIPNTLKEFSKEINELLEIIATDLINANL